MLKIPTPTPIIIERKTVKTSGTIPYKLRPIPKTIPMEAYNIPQRLNLIVPAIIVPITAPPPNEDRIIPKAGAPPIKR
jgi:hypothetical protein